MPTLLTALLKRFTATAQTEARFSDTLLVQQEADDERARGCGWFDSSHELKAGLEVMEHASADAVASQMPLGDWLAMHLGGWQPEVTAV